MFVGNRSSIPHLVLLCALGTGCAYVDVPAGHVAVNWTLSGMSPKIYKEGEWNIGYYDKATVLDARSQEREERLNVLCSNGEQIVLDTSVRYHLVADEALQLVQDLGIHYYAKLLGPTLRSQARRVIGRYLPEEIYSTKREIIEREIREGFESAIKGRHIVLEVVLIRDVMLPPEIQQAINDKLEAEQQSLKQKYLLETAKQVADRQKVEAEAAAEQTRIRVQADADGRRIAALADADDKRTAAKATADYEKLVQANLTPQLLEWQRIEAMSDLSRSQNAKVIFMGAGAGKTTPLLDVK
jgi:regulator of protease activity HflC (stomatin/prohibitin superfamily)